MSFVYRDTVQNFPATTADAVVDRDLALAANRLNKAYRQVRQSFFLVNSQIVSESNPAACLYLFTIEWVEAANCASTALAMPLPGNRPFSQTSPNY